MQVSRWQPVLRHDAIAPLLSSQNVAVVFFAACDLLDEKRDAQMLWDQPDAQRIIRRQQSNGSWKYPGGNNAIRSEENYNQLETYRNLGYLVEMFGFDRRSPVIADAAEFLWGFQTREGDIRGILGNQYTPYYTAAIVELLIKAGYGDDPRVARAFAWLNAMRQDDGGWALPLRTRGRKLDVISMSEPALEPDRAKPFSHFVTGVVLRAYAAHPEYRASKEAWQAGELLLSRLFRRDRYPDRAAPDFWVRFTFPFWFTDLISATDSLSLIGFNACEPRIHAAATWFISHQSRDGLWRLPALKNLQYGNNLWFSLAICRIMKRLYE